MATIGQRFNFGYSQSTVHVFRDEVLGTGSYGTVYKAKVGNLFCAAKTPHFQPAAGSLSGRGGEESGAGVARRFREECELLSALRHPNIVQYLGVFEDPSSRQQLLLMELMNNENLTQFLDKTPRPLPFHLQVNICHDVSVALAYLHSNQIIHRDVSASNVLLIGNALKAKLCGFSVATLLSINPSFRQLLTVCPGTSVYMPPEALRDNPKYDKKLDCFSLGVLVVHILTRQFPQPTDRSEMLPDGQGRETFVRLVPEVKRRRNHISLIDPHNALLRIALECLKDEAVERPTAQQICDKVGVLKISQPYRESDVLSTGREVEVAEPRQVFASMPILRAQTGRQDQVQEIEGLRKEIQSLKQQLQEKDMLFEDVFENAQIQQKFLEEKKAKLVEEKRLSDQLKQQISVLQNDERQHQQQLAYYRKQCDDLSRHFHHQSQLKQTEIDRLTQESVQAGNFIVVLQQQVNDVEERERKCQQDLSQTNDELSKCIRNRNEDKLRATEERDRLNDRLHELTEERDALDGRLQETSREISQLRDALEHSSKTQTERIREKERQIQELQRRLEDSNRGVVVEEQRFTSLKQIVPSGDSWNIARDEVIMSQDKEIGRGASGLVMEGRYQNQQVAVKQIHKDILHNSSILDEFKREVRIMASIKHPNLVRFIAAVFDDDVERRLKSPLLVLELLQTDLRSAYQNGDIETQYQKISIFRDIAYGLHYLHEHLDPIVHRDVSTANVLLESFQGSPGSWRAKLSDFGSANFLKHAKSLGVGAIVYTAPEMYPQNDPRSPMPRPTTKCDIFSYGIMLVEVITKIMPTTENRHILFREVESKWRLMYELASRCTKTDPNDRPSMTDVLNSINRIPIARPRNRSIQSISSQSSLDTSSWSSYNRD